MLVYRGLVASFMYTCSNIVGHTKCPFLLLLNVVSLASFLADYVFDETVNTQSVFKTLVEPIVLSVMEGFNGKLLRQIHVVHLSPPSYM